MRWHPTMTPEEEAELLREAQALEDAYAEAEAFDKAHSRQPLTEDEILEAEAEIEQSREYFDRYIAGDR